MQAITEAELRRFAPGAKDVYVEALIHGWSDLERAGVTTPLRLCEFLAQTAHETGGYSIIREHTTWTAKQMTALWPGRFKTALDPRIVACGRDPRKLANLAYAGRSDIGNCGGDDGWLYRGGGFLQLTGRGGYRECGAAIGCDLEGQPELIEMGSVSLKAALWVWQDFGGLNRLADRHYTRAIGNAINRGSPYSSHDPIGHKDRLRWFDRAWAVFGDSATPKTLPGLALGAHGAEVRALQEQLRSLGYGIGKVDETFGPAVARAVAGFKADHLRETGVDLGPGEAVTADVWDALRAAKPVRHSADRRNATAKELAAEGSTEIVAGQQTQVVGTVTTVTGAAVAADKAGLVDQAKEAVGWLPEAQSVLVPVIEAVRWGVGHVGWVIAIVGGVWFWTRGRAVVSARLAAHRAGWNMWR